MSEVSSFRGWGKESFYVCDNCGHSKSIYEGTTFAPYLFFILFEIVIFILSDSVSLIGYLFYGILLIFLCYMAYKAYMYDKKIANNYAIQCEFKGEFAPNDIQKEALIAYKNKAFSSGKNIKKAIALFIFVSYTVMFYFQNNLSYMDYIGYAIVGICLPLWLLIIKER